MNNSQLRKRGYRFSRNSANTEWSVYLKTKLYSLPYQPLIARGPIFSNQQAFNDMTDAARNDWALHRLKGNAI